MSPLATGWPNGTTVPFNKESFSFLKSGGRGFLRETSQNIFCPLQLNGMGSMPVFGKRSKSKEDRFLRCQNRLMEALPSVCPGILGASRKLSAVDIPSHSPEDLLL